MYLIWGPCYAPRVALGKMEWNWYGEAEFVNSQWILSATSRHSPSVTWTPADPTPVLRVPIENATSLDWVRIPELRRRYE